VEAGDLSGAEGYFRQAVDASPSSAAALYGHGYVLGKLGDSAGARSQLCRALELSGSNVDMQREIEGSLRNIGASCG
jgi:Flp pilus assembly protein TadD